MHSSQWGLGVGDSKAGPLSLVSLGLKICLPKTLLKMRDQLKRYPENRLKTWPGYIL